MVQGYLSTFQEHLICMVPITANLSLKEPYGDPTSFFANKNQLFYRKLLS